jgi:hypothetical protein
LAEWCLRQLRETVSHYVALGGTVQTVRVTAEFDINISDLDAMQAMAHEQFTHLMEESGPLVSDIVDTKQQGADVAAQNVRWAVMMLTSQLLAHGVKAAFPAGSTVANLRTNINAPNGPAS